MRVDYVTSHSKFPYICIILGLNELSDVVHVEQYLHMITQGIPL